MMDIEKQKNFIFRFVFWLIVMGMVYFFLKYVLPALTPFIIGFIVAVALKPFADRLAAVTGIKQRRIAVIILLLFYIGMAALLGLSGVKIGALIGGFFQAIPDYYRATIEPALGQLFNTITTFLQELDPSLQTTIQGLTGSAISSTANLVTSVSTAALNWLAGFAGGFPLFVVNFIISVIASFYVSADFPGMKMFVVRQIQPDRLQFMRTIRDNSTKMLGKFIKAYFIMMVLMFAELTIGLWLIRIDKAPLIAMGIALFDAFPVLGTGGILIPWAIIEIIIGRFSRGIEILILYGIVYVIRNILEPRVVGQQIGLHPLATLLCMYLGASLFGIVGLLGLPLAASIINSLNENGTIRLFKKRADAEP